MKRFNYDEDDGGDYKDEFFLPNDIGEDQEDYNIIDEVEEENFWHEINIKYSRLNLIKSEQDHKLLFRAIRILEKSWFWSFRSQNYKVKKIIETFLMLKNIINLPSDNEKTTGEAIKRKK